MELWTKDFENNLNKEQQQALALEANKTGNNLTILNLFCRKLSVTPVAASAPASEVRAGTVFFYLEQKIEPPKLKDFTTLMVFLF